MWYTVSIEDSGGIAVRNFLYRLRDAFYRFMSGRYGYDKLSLYLLVAAVVFSVLSRFVLPLVFLLLYYVCFIFAMYRCFSKNIAKRQKELYKFEKQKTKIKQFFLRQKNRFKERKTHIYFKCNCGTHLRLPRKKGVLTVKCPVCGKEKVKKIK